MRIINLTPHALNVHGELGVITLPPSGAVARVQVSRKQIDCFDEIDIYRTYYGKVEGLPPETHNTFLVVSAIVKLAAPDREDLLSPGELIRDDKGQPIGCKGLSL